MMSLNQAAQTLQIGKPRLNRLITENKISPTPDGNRKILTEDQIKQLKKSLARSKKQLVQPKFPELAHEPIRTRSRKKSAKISKPVTELSRAEDSQIDYLPKLLESEKAQLGPEKKDGEFYEDILLSMRKILGQILKASKSGIDFLKLIIEQNRQEMLFEKFSRVFNRK